VFPEQSQAGLPEPESAALAHSERLRERILAAIAAAGGSIPFSQYMQMALYEPGCGYYSAGAVKFGPAGDFVTAVDQGDFLARAIVATLAPRLAAQAEPVIVELGAGTGKLANDILHLLDEHRLDHVAYRILEPSPDLRARQARTLASLAADSARVSWIERLEPASVCGAVVANEVADALPVDRLLRAEAGWEQLAVACDGRDFCWRREPLTQSQRKCIDSICARLPEPLHTGYTTEIRPLLSGWIESICGALADGDVLLVDYGMSRREYFHPQRDTGTLMCHYRHRAHGNAFLYPGLQDITAWVDFSECADAAAASGMHVAGYATQGSWIAAALHADPVLTEGPDAAQAAALRTLLLPGEMGERFKALLLSRPAEAGPEPALPGRDLRSRL
jgi:SAM-dependent MidA family methyltransferase